MRTLGDTAALVAGLDLVIAVDTAVCHLAGALGRPVWLLNRFDTCWRWLLEGDDSVWYRSLRQPVRFAAASEHLLADGYRFFIEASPHPALVVPLLETADQAGTEAVVVGSLRRDRDDLGCLLRSLGELHSRGLARR